MSRQDARVGLASGEHALAQGPGCLGRGGAASALLFLAGASMRDMDLLAVFWGEEAPGLDWLLHYLRDPAMDALLARLARPPEQDFDEEPEDEEIVYSRSQLTTLGSEVVDGP
jgi:hypothetical protein